MKPREPRRPVMIAARLRWSGDWRNGTIRNLSTRGLMVAVEPAPPRGAYVEVRIGIASVIGVSVWSDGAHAGVQTRERIDPAALLGARAATAGSSYPEVERRATPRIASPDPNGRARAAGSFLQFATLAFVATAAAGSLGWEAYQALSSPINKVEASL